MAKSVIRALPGIGILVAILIALYARYIEPKRLEVTRLNLTQGDDTLTIAFVTDIHIGPSFSAIDLEATIDTLEHLQPDVILFGGDFICESPRFLNDLEAPLSRMTATATIGSWGIWGNHDLANIRSRCEPVLERSGVQMLTNESAQIKADLWVVGIDDVLLGKADVDRSFANVPDNARVIALWHEPDVVTQLIPFRPMLILSGHTHGGQVRLPGIGALAAPSLGKKYVAGEFYFEGIPLYVSRGIGMYRPPVRLNCRPELLVLRVDSSGKSPLAPHAPRCHDQAG